MYVTDYSSYQDVVVVASENSGCRNAVVIAEADKVVVTTAVYFSQNKKHLSHKRTRFRFGHSQTRVVLQPSHGRATKALHGTAS
mmetsp:Transcript_2700/g.5687  ORF Transcript_2700/g.5687 Transcript_2700/m.5687 type:complete len:84 (-) Transcript_2700:938-1189(-)